MLQIKNTRIFLIIMISIFWLFYNNIFHLSHQAGTIWRHAYSNYICFSAKGASLRFYSPSCFCRAIQIGRLLWYILRWWWQSLCQNIHRQTCPVCFLRSILLLILMILLHFDMIWFVWIGKVTVEMSQSRIFAAFITTFIL